MNKPQLIQAYFFSNYNVLNKAKKVINLFSLQGNKIKTTEEQYSDPSHLSSCYCCHFYFRQPLGFSKQLSEHLKMKLIHCYKAGKRYKNIEPIPASDFNWEGQS